MGVELAAAMGGGGEVGATGVGTGDTDAGLSGDDDPSIVCCCCWGIVIVAPIELLRGSLLVSLDGELGQELCGEIGGVGGI